MSPKLGNGKICYILLPAIDPAVSAAFYERVFGWEIRRRENGELTFNDGVGEVSGAWVTGCPPATQAGLLVYLMVADAEATLQLVAASGGGVDMPVTTFGPTTVAKFIDPAGNIMGLYQEPTLADAAARIAAA